MLKYTREYIKYSRLSIENIATVKQIKQIIHSTPFSIRVLQKFVIRMSLDAPADMPLEVYEVNLIL